MDYKRLTQNLISVIKEAQIKLGYEEIPIGVNYVLPSLIHLLGNEVNEKNIEDILLVFARSSEEIFGKIDVKKIENGFRLTVSEKGVKYVNSLIKPDDFLVKFINEVKNPLATIDSVINVFRQYSDKVVVRKTEDNSEFDYVIYFEDGKPDRFWYCIDTEDLGITYHRFTMEDYTDFDF